LKLLLVVGVLLLGGSLFVAASVYSVNPPYFQSNFQYPITWGSTFGLAALGVLSILLAAANTPRSYARPLGVALLIVAVLVPSFFAYEIYVAPPIIGCLGCTGPEYLVILSGSIAQSPSGSWNLTVWAKNDASGPVTMISVTNSSTLPQSTTLVFDYNGAAVSSSNPLPLGYTAVGSMQLQNLTVGNTYAMTVSTSVQGSGEFGPQTLVMTAQA
jgi:hypothetical protein